MGSVIHAAVTIPFLFTLEDSHIIGIGGVLLGTILGGLIAYLIWDFRSRRSKAAAEKALQAQKEKAERGNENFEHWIYKKRVDELTKENKELTSLLVVALPGLTRKIIQAKSKRDVAPLLLTAVERLCIPSPEKILIFLRGSNQEELVLAAQKGYDRQLLDNLRISMDKGRLGWAISKQITLDQKDFEREERLGNLTESSYPFNTEVASPIVYKREVQGAMSVEGFATYNNNVKKMLIVVANLAAMAISNVSLLQQIQHMADCDQLTQLYNKRYFVDALEKELEKAKLNQGTFSVVMFDIDHFKNYNDTNGHQMGDEALRLTGQLVLQRKRESDVAARYGGEEFIVLLADTPKEGARIFAESLRQIIQDYPYPGQENQPMKTVTVSGGVATYPEDGKTLKELVQKADEGLYESKENGRNSIGGERPPGAPFYEGPDLRAVHSSSDAEDAG